MAPASADVVDDIIARGELRVAVQTQGPPVSFVDKNGDGLFDDPGEVGDLVFVHLHLRQIHLGIAVVLVYLGCQVQMIAEELEGHAALVAEEAH